MMTILARQAQQDRNAEAIKQLRGLISDAHDLSEHAHNFEANELHLLPIADANFIKHYLTILADACQSAGDALAGNVKMTL
jgi:hypothetical protein